MKAVPLTINALQSLGLHSYQTATDTFTNYKLEKAGNVLKLKKYSRFHAQSFIHKSRPNSSYLNSLGRRQTPRPRRKDNIHRTKSRLVDLVRCNRTPDTWFMTFTYKDEMTSRSQAIADYRQNIKRLEAYHGKPIKEVHVFELQKRGTWHIHALIFGIPYYTNEEWASMFWQKGFVMRDHVKDDNVAFYLTKYLVKDLTDKNFIRGYSCSRDLKRPEEVTNLHEAYRLLAYYVQKQALYTISAPYTNPYTKSTTQYAEIYVPT